MDFSFTKYFASLPLAKYPNQAFGSDLVEYVKSYYQNNSKAPLNVSDNQEHLVVFEEDLWDFSAFSEQNKLHKVRINFDKTYPEINLNLKLFVVYLIITSHYFFSSIISIVEKTSIALRTIAKQSPDSFRLNIITTEQVLNYLGQLKSEHYKRHSCLALLKFFDFIKINQGYNLGLDLEILAQTVREFTHSITNSKTISSDIPLEYSQSLFKTFDQVMSDSKQATNYRRTAAIMMIMMQTGLRVSDLLNLKVNSLVQLPNKDGTKYRPFFAYVPIKTKKQRLDNQSFVEDRVFYVHVNKVALKAYSILVDLQPNSNPNNYLIYSKFSNGNQSLHSSCFHSRYGVFCKKFLPSDMVVSPRSDLGSFKIEEKGKFYQTYLPTFTQYRVHFCTFLRKNGTSALYVEYCLGHKYHALSDYYNVS